MCEVDTSCSLSAHEFYKKHYVEEKCSNIFEEVDDGQYDNLGVKKKSAKSSVPIDLAIKEPPKSHEELTKFLQEHLRISNLEFISLDDQKELADTLTMAIISIWPEHRKQGSDPFLSEIGNIELQRRITVYIVQTAEELFYEYITRAQEINEKAVFSAEANLSRLKTQILHEANTCLNALKVRRKLAGHMRHVADEQWLKKGEYNKDRMLLYDDFGQLDTKMKSRLEKAHRQFTKRQVDEINAHLKNIDLSLNTSSYVDLNNERNAHILSHLTNVDANNESGSSTVTSTSDKNKCEGSEETVATSIRDNLFIRHSSSMPNLQADAESQEEFGELNIVQSGRTRSIDQLLDEVLRDKKYVDVKLEHVVSSKEKGDLHIEELDDDFSPLLQVQETKQKRKNRAAFQAVTICEDEEEDLFTDVLTDEVEDGEILSGYKHLSQPSSVNVKVPGRGIVRISDSSISTRINECMLILHKYPTMYNEFLEEIDDATVKSLDEHLFAGKQAQEVYDEITKTMSKDFLCFDKDDFVEKCAPPALDTTSLFMSALLQERQKAHLISDELRIETEPPWSKFNSNDDWRNYPRFGGLGREEILQLQSKSKENNDMYGISKNISFPNNATARNSAATTTMEVAPAISNIINTTTNTTSAITITNNNFNIVPSNSHIQKSYSAWLSWYKTHLDTDDYKKFLCKKENDHLCQLFHLYDSEDSEGEEEEDLYNKCLELQFLEQQQKRKEEIRLQKKQYEEGYWNTQCVVLGGLGKDPDLNDVERTENSDEAEKLTDDEKDPTDICLQERLERIWKLLKVPEQYRVDMAMKYSDIAGAERLPEAIECWENVTDFIIDRENLMGTLECFERSASDPNRFFQKGPSGSSVARINEAKTREKLIKTIKTLEEEIKPKLAHILKQFGDIVSYQGRVYSQKLQTDRVEMLYWLQQERRQQALQCNTANIAGVSSVKYVNMTPTIT